MATKTVQNHDWVLLWVITAMLIQQCDQKSWQLCHRDGEFVAKQILGVTLSGKVLKNHIRVVFQLTQF